MGVTILKNKAQSQFIGNLSYAFVAQVISLLLSILMSLVVPKLLGVEEFSYWQLFVFYINYVGFFHFGLTDGVYLRYGGVEYDKLNKSLIGSQFWMLVLIQLIVAIGIFGFSALFIDDSQRKFVLNFTAVYMVAANMTWFLGYVFQATNETRLYSISVIIDKAVFMMAVIGLIFIHTGRFQIFVLLYLVGKALSLVYSMIKGREIVFVKWLPFRKTAFAALCNIEIGINLTLSSIASILILGFGRFLVDKVWGITAFGKFSFSLSLTNFFLLFISQVSMVLFPALRQSSEGQLSKYYNYMRNTLGLLLPVVLLAYIPMRYLLGLWLPQYQESLSYLALLLPLCTFDGKMQMLCNTYFKVLRKEKLLLKLNVVSMSISIVLSLLGAYVFDSINFIVISMVVAIAFRSVISEIHLARLMGNSVISSLIQEMILVVVFMLCSWYLNSLIGFLVFLIAYITYIAMNNKKLRIICITSKLLFKRG